MKAVKLNHPKSRVFASLKAAASAKGVSETLLKDAKAMGCSAFRANNSVVEDELDEFLAKHSTELSKEGGGALRDQKVIQEIRKLRIRNDRDEGKLVPIDKVKSSISRTLAAVDSLLEQKLANEYPSAVAGLEVPQARVFGKRLGDQIREAFQQLAREWA